jgi:hypothetical protein
MASWEDVNQAVAAALAEGWLVDYRDTLPTHADRSFARRSSPADILGDCTHQSASPNQDPVRTARYHVGPNHVSDRGCPGLLYTFAISQQVEPDKVLLCNDLEAITWSQGKGTDGNEGWSGDENRHLVSILLMGDFEDDCNRGAQGPSWSQIDRWVKVRCWLRSLFGYGPGATFGHFDFGKSACPGRVLRERILSERAGHPGLDGALAWQEALLRWDPNCLPRWGADGAWGGESKAALRAFERAHKHRVDGMRDPFTALLLKKYGSG